MTFYKKWFFLIGFIVAENNLCLGQPVDPTTNSHIDELETRFPGLLDSAHIPGMSIAIIDKVKVVWNKGFVVMNKESEVVVDDQPIFPAASLESLFSPRLY